MISLQQHLCILSLSQEHRHPIALSRAHEIGAALDMTADDSVSKLVNLFDVVVVTNKRFMELKIYGIDLYDQPDRLFSTFVKYSLPWQST